MPQQKPLIIPDQFHPEHKIHSATHSVVLPSEQELFSFK